MNVKGGGFYRYPNPTYFKELRERLISAQESAFDATLFLSKLEFPDFNMDYEYVSLRHPAEYPMNEGRVVSNKGLDIDVEEYEEVFTEEHMPYSTTLHTSLEENKVIHTGPLARYNLNFDKLTKESQQLAGQINLDQKLNNPFKSLLVRMIEVFYACGEAIDIIDNYKVLDKINDQVKVQAGESQAVTEAPRGILYHRYKIDQKGIIQNAKIVAPTSHNQKVIEQDLRNVVEQFQSMGDEKLTERCESTVRNYDPCISCSTHFLNVTIDRG
jgi:coenzyme F420-reducing hydrogenase alpha subunit